MLLTEAFPIRGTSPPEPKPYFDRESGHHIADRERSEAFQPWKMLSEVQSKCGVRGRTELHERVSTMNGNKNPKAERHASLRRGGKMASRQPLGSSHRGGREVGG